MGTAGFDRPEDHWPRAWAEAFVHFAAGEMRSWIKAQGIGLFPVVQWAERGGYQGSAHGNSVPRFHLAWGTGPGVVTPILKRVMAHVREGRIQLRFRHRVTELVSTSGTVTGVTGEVLVPSAVARGEASSRDVESDFTLHAQAVIVCSGGIGGNFDLVRRFWPADSGPAPVELLAGVPASTDGLMIDVAERAGGRRINSDRMWHYAEGVVNHSPVWPAHGIRILAGPSSLWLDARGNRLPAPLWPGFDTRGTVAHILSTGFSHSWLVLNQRTIGPEFALSGSEQNTDMTGKSIRALLKNRLSDGPTDAVAAFQERGVDFLTADSLPELVAKMNALAGADLVDAASVVRHRRGPRPAGPVGARQGPAVGGGRRRAAVLRRPQDAHRGAARIARPRRRPAGRGAPAHPHPEDARRPGDRPVVAGAAARRGARPGPVRGGRGGRFRRRRGARVPLPGGHLPGRLPVQRSGRRPGRRSLGASDPHLRSVGHPGRRARCPTARCGQAG